MQQYPQLIQQESSQMEPEQSEPQSNQQSSEMEQQNIDLDTQPVVLFQKHISNRLSYHSIFQLFQSKDNQFLLYCGDLSLRLNGYLGIIPQKREIDINMLENEINLVGEVPISNKVYYRQEEKVFSIHRETFQKKQTKIPSKIVTMSAFPNEEVVVGFDQKYFSIINLQTEEEPISFYSQKAPVNNFLADGNSLFINYSVDEYKRVSNWSCIDIEYNQKIFQLFDYSPKMEFIDKNILAVNHIRTKKTNLNLFDIRTLRNTLSFQFNCFSNREQIVWCKLNNDYTLACFLDEQGCFIDIRKGILNEGLRDKINSDWEQIRKVQALTNGKFAIVKYRAPRCGLGQGCSTIMMCTL